VTFNAMLGNREYVIRDLMSHPLASSHTATIPEYFGYYVAVHFLTSPLTIFTLFLLPSIPRTYYQRCSGSPIPQASHFGSLNRRHNKASMLQLTASFRIRFSRCLYIEARTCGFRNNVQACYTRFLINISDFFFII
jgi:hypothetical protein